MKASHTNAPALMAIKAGSTRVFQDGRSLHVTVLYVPSNVVTQVKRAASDGYSAIQVAAGKRSPRRMNQALLGHLRGAGLTTLARLQEQRVSEDLLDSFDVGNLLDLSAFGDVSHVNIQGTTKGKGFQGAVKRWNFRTQDASHGNSLSHRAPGSIGQCQDPGRVFKGKKMAGQMGNVLRTARNLELVDVNVEGQFILVKGAVPGAKGGWLTVIPSRAQTPASEAA